MTQFIEEFDVYPGLMPIDLSAAANTGNWVSLEGFYYLSLLFIGESGGSAAATATENPVLTFSQATAGDGTGTKALNLLNYWVKQPPGSDEDLVSGEHGWTRNSLTTATNSITLTGSAGKQKLAMFDFRAGDFDVDNGFRWAQCSIADSGTNAQLGCMAWFGRRYRMTGDQTLAAKL